MSAGLRWAICILLVLLVVEAIEILAPLTWGYWPDVLAGLWIGGVVALYVWGRITKQDRHAWPPVYRRYRD